MARSQTGRAALTLLAFPTAKARPARREKVSDLALRVMQLEAIDTMGISTTLLDGLVDGFLSTHGDTAARARTNRRRAEMARDELARAQRGGR